MSVLYQDYQEFQANHSVVEPQTLPPYTSGKPYVVSSQDGEIIYIPLSKSATRLLVTGKETEGAFAVVGSGGSQGDPIGFHYHRETHDVFLCTKGAINVWAGDKCRTMGPGDFAGVPPGTIHQYQILGDHSEMMGLIVPGGWEEFFRFIGEPYSGPMWPLQDERDFFQVLLPKLKAASEHFDMIPCPQQKSFDPQPWLDTEHRLPGALEPYFLKSNTGPAYAVAGMVCRPLITTAESDGKFSIGIIEGSSRHHEYGIFAPSDRRLYFANVHHAFHVIDGRVDFKFDDCSTKLTAGQLLYIPKGTAFRFTINSRVARMQAFSNGEGLVGTLQSLGKAHHSSILPETPQPLDAHQVHQLDSLGAGSHIRR